MKVTDLCAKRGEDTVIICDFSPPRAADSKYLEPAKGFDADFISVAYNPGRAVRVDSAMMAYAIKSQTGKDAIFTLGTRDMNKLALQSHLMGAQMLGLDNVVIVQGDPFSAKERDSVKGVQDFSPTTLMAATAEMNEGKDFRGRDLRKPTDFCIGATLDLTRDNDREARLASRKADAGVHFFMTQPIFGVDEIDRFLEIYTDQAGHELRQPVFWGVQVLTPDGVIFSSVPEQVRKDLEKGRDGAEIALELVVQLLEAGLGKIYLVAPIMKGGARDYDAAQRVIEGIKIIS